MTEENKKGRAPDFKSDGVSIWKNIDKNGDVYLNIKLSWIPNMCFNCFPVKEKKTREDGVL